MASLDSLNDLQRATLQLLLKQGKSYDEIAALLKTSSSAIQSRAHDAVAAIGPASPDIGDDRRREVADYLLGQQTASRRAATREYLEDSADGRSWARAVAGALRPMAGDDLPEIPAEPAEVDEAFEALDKRAARQEEVQRSSQLGTMIIFGALGLLVAIVLIIVLGVFDGDEEPKAKTATATRTARTTPTEQPRVVLQGDLRPPRGSGSKASGETAIVNYQKANQFKLLIAAKDMQPAPEGSAYARLALQLARPDALHRLPEGDRQRQGHARGRRGPHAADADLRAGARHARARREARQARHDRAARERSRCRRRRRRDDDDRADADADGAVVLLARRVDPATPRRSG